VESEVDRALDVLGVPRRGSDGSTLSQDDRLGLWVRDPARAPRADARAIPSSGPQPVR
jgi:hypothetical protein